MKREKFTLSILILAAIQMVACKEEGMAPMLVDQANKNRGLIATNISNTLAVSSASTLHVGTGFQYATLAAAAAVAQPGDTILVHQGTYGGMQYVENLQGTASAWIYIFTAPGETVIYEGGTQAWQFVDGAYLHIRGFIFQKQTDNGVNMDDGGDYSTPSHHILFENCTFRDIAGTSNNDLLKMSGVDNFEIRNCTFLNGSVGAGNAIDMVGCHDGLIKNSRFENMGAGSVQAKGGSRNVRIEANFFKNGGLRAVNLGGSTGMQYFRPANVNYEARDLKVYANVFVGGAAAVAFVGSVYCEAVNNTIYLPTRYVLRILQETKGRGFLRCGNNTFRNNIIFRNSQVLEDCNIGPATDPQSFTFSNDLWFHSQNPTWAGPVLPVQDVNSIVGQDPLFVNASAENFFLQSTSPAIGRGYSVAEPAYDYSGAVFKSPRAIGAFEGN